MIIWRFSNNTSSLRILLNFRHQFEDHKPQHSEKITNSSSTDSLIDPKHPLLCCAATEISKNNKKDCRRANKSTQSESDELGRKPDKRDTQNPRNPPATSINSHRCRQNWQSKEDLILERFYNDIFTVSHLMSNLIVKFHTSFN